MCECQYASAPPPPLTLLGEGERCCDHCNYISDTHAFTCINPTSTCACVCMNEYKHVCVCLMWMYWCKQVFWHAARPGIERRSARSFIFCLGNVCYLMKISAIQNGFHISVFYYAKYLIIFQYLDCLRPTCTATCYKVDILNILHKYSTFY